MLEHQNFLKRHCRKSLQLTCFHVHIVELAFMLFPIFQKGKKLYVGFYFKSFNKVQNLANMKSPMMLFGFFLFETF